MLASKYMCLSVCYWFSAFSNYASTDDVATVSLSVLIFHFMLSVLVVVVVGGVGVLHQNGSYQIHRRISSTISVNV